MKCRPFIPFGMATTAPRESLPNAQLRDPVNRDRLVSGWEPLNQVQKRGRLNTACYRVVLVLLAVVAWVAVGAVGDTLSIGVEGFRETASSEADAPQPPDRELHQGGAGRSNRSDRTSNSARTATTATAIQLP